MEPVYPPGQSTHLAWPPASVWLYLPTAQGSQTAGVEVSLYTKPGLQGMQTAVLESLLAGSHGGNRSRAASLDVIDSSVAWPAHTRSAPPCTMKSLAWHAATDDTRAPENSEPSSALSTSVQCTAA